MMILTIYIISMLWIFGPLGSGFVIIVLYGTNLDQDPDPSNISKKK